MYVYFVSGAIEQVIPANRVELTQEEIAVFYSLVPVIRIKRRDVLFMSRVRIAPFGF